MTRVSPGAEGGDLVDFERQVRPLLESRCIDCHGAERRRSGLRLDVRAQALAGGDSGVPGIVPGERQESELFLRLKSSDPDLRMPLGDEPLSPREIELLGSWIDQGANWPEQSEGKLAGAVHWAYQPVERPSLPEVDDPDWCRNPVDRFVLEELESRGIRPSPEADRATLLRRVSLDLIGLPPTEAELQAFLADESPSAYERCVDRLLASPHYGEKWGRHWLDLARYSDSHGYTFDGARSMWPYRDWVVSALNADMPYDRFTLEQLAGDLLENPTRDQLVATGFHRNTQVNEENGVDPEEDRIEAVKDRVDTTGTVWLGSTLACAQCHSHKYDPFTQKDYYRIFAFFNQTSDIGGYRAALLGPRVDLPTPEEELRIAEIEEQAERLRQSVQTAALKRGDTFAGWAHDYRSSQEDWQILEGNARSSGGVELLPQEDGSWLAVGSPPETISYRVALTPDQTRLSAIRLEVLPDPLLGRAESGSFVLTGFRVEREGKPVEIASAVESYYQHFNYRKGASRGAINFELEPFREESWRAADALDGRGDTGWAVMPQSGLPQRAVFVFAEPLELEPGETLEVVMDQEAGDFRTLARFSLWGTEISDPSGGTESYSRRISKILSLRAEERSEEQRDYLARYYVGRSRAWLEERIAIERLENSKPPVATSLVLEPVRKQRRTRLLKGGSFLTPGIEVEPGVPDFLPALGGDEIPTRADLARWLTSPENPLTHRVLVNRLWQRLFGLGLVETEDDFGTRGALPSHPELLDWLASEFVAGGQLRKPLLRTIVTSATYRQASNPRGDLVEIDPRNRLLARQSRMRTDAETLRDTALAVSGLLSPELGGPPVYPPQPDGVFRFTQKPKTWRASEGEARFRRTLYTWHWRSSPFPFLTTFDADLGKRSCTRRRVSNTPLQALNLANDPMFIEIAQGLAQRALELRDGDLEARLSRVFRWCMARPPDATELATLEAFFQRHLELFSEQPGQAELLAPGSRSSGAPVEGAAWTALARVLLNLDEFVTRN